MPTVVLSIAGVTNIATAEGQDQYFQQAGVIQRLPPVYVFDNYSINVLSSIELSQGDTPHTISSVAMSSTPSNLFDYTETVNTVTIQTGSSSPFSEYWKFLMPDKSYTQVDSPNDLVEADVATWDELVEWAPPSESSVDVAHSITVTYYKNTTPNTLIQSNVILSQGMYFKYEPNTNILKQIASKTYVP
jgi:hypothetical protein